MNTRLTTLSAIILLSLSHPAYSGNTCVHGTSGVLQSGQGTAYGWGLAMSPDMAGHWVHYSIPVDLYDPNDYTEYLRIKLSRGQCNEITEVHVWRSDTKIASYARNIDFDQPPEGSGQYLDIPLTLMHPTDAIGVSIKVANLDAGGPGCANYEGITINSVCTLDAAANFNTAVIDPDLVNPEPLNPAPFDPDQVELEQIR